MRILIVEDDFTSRRMLQLMLAPYGQCDIAVDGIEAVNVFEQTLKNGVPYQLVCLDIMMPKMDGQQALKAMRSLEKDMGVDPRNETKMIMTTCLDSPKEVIEAYYHGGCTSYLVKPIEKSKLINELKELQLIP